MAPIIDLRPFFDLKTRTFDFPRFQKFLLELSQDRYDEILANAREFRKDSDKKFRENQVDLSQRIIDYILSNYKR